MSEATAEIQFQTTLRSGKALFTLLIDVEEWKKIDGMTSGLIVIRRSTAVKDGR